MADKVIKKNQALVPFWGGKMTFVRGLDPLGLQNASEKAYSYLLPGLNNVTGLIRAYSFYCWLLREYARQIDSTDPAKQRRFVRMAEYLLAVVSSHHGIQGVSGTLYAGAQLAKGLAEIDLATGIYNSEGGTTGTFWDNPNGVLGAYYLGSMRQIGLIDEPEDPLTGKPLGISRITDNSYSNLKVTGKDLAQAFDNALSPAGKALFLKCMVTERVSVRDLPALAADFHLHTIAFGGEEWQLLKTLLMSTDTPGFPPEQSESMRRRTIVHLLRLAEKHPKGMEPREVAWFAYDEKGMMDGAQDDCLTGWYYYQLNEYYQYACTALFNRCLCIVQEEMASGWKSLDDLLQEITKEVVGMLNSAFKKLPKQATLNDVMQGLNYDENDLVYDIASPDRIEACLMNSFLLLWQLHINNHSHLLRLNTFIRRHGLETENDVLAYFQHLERVKEQPLHLHVSSFLLHKILLRHRFVAFSKMGNGSKSTEKFILEDRFVRVIDTFEPGFTGPRLNNLAAFLRDLNFLKQGNALSKAGRELLKSESV